MFALACTWHQYAMLTVEKGAHLPRRQKLSGLGLYIVMDYTAQGLKFTGVSWLESAWSSWIISQPLKALLSLDCEHYGFCKLERSNL